MPKITPTHWTVLEHVFLRDGWQFDRQEGSHRPYVKAGFLRPIVIPTYRAVPVSIIRNNTKTATMNRMIVDGLLVMSEGS